MKIFSKNKKGFTLIELLVVIAIISLLSSVVFSSLKTARAKARDSARIGAIHEVQSALEVYYSTNLTYPNGNAGTSSYTGLAASLVPTYIKQISAIPGRSGAAPGTLNALSAAYWADSSLPGFYAILVPYETKSPCYVCMGSRSSAPGTPGRCPQFDDGHSSYWTSAPFCGGATGSSSSAVTVSVTVDNSYPPETSLSWTTSGNSCNVSYPGFSQTFSGSTGSKTKIDCTGLSNSVTVTC